MLQQCEHPTVFPTCSGKAQQQEQCRESSSKLWAKTPRGVQIPNYKVWGLTIKNNALCSYLQELALQEAANYISHLNLFIRLRQSTFQSDAQNVSKIVPGQKCKCIRFLSEQIKTKHHTGTTPRFLPPCSIRLTDSVRAVRLNICSSTKLPLRGRSKKAFFFFNLLRAKILDFGDGGNKSSDTVQQGSILKPEL